MSYEKLSQLARDIRFHENNVDRLESLMFIQKGYIGKCNKNDDEWSYEKAVQEFVHKDICPYCLNIIDWNKLNELISEHKEAISKLNKELRAI